jgi:hypothetical protein
MLHCRQTRPPGGRPQRRAQPSSAGIAPNGAMKRTLLLTWLACAFAAEAQRIGEADTVFKLIGPDHKIVA